MTDMTCQAPRPAAPLELPRRLLAAWAARRRRRAELAALARLDDHLLRDIGLDPGDVPRPPRPLNVLGRSFLTACRQEPPLLPAVGPSGARR